MKPAFCLGLSLCVLACLVAGCAESSTSGEVATEDTGATEVTSDVATTEPPGDVEAQGALTDTGEPGSGFGLDQADASEPSADASPSAVDTASPEPDAEEPVQEHFSFFVTSLEAMQELSGSLDGFGGNLGGLEGADEICQTIAATVDGDGKVWRAFLSVTAGPDGQPVHAIDRIGDGPWYDRNGRLVALNKEDLVAERPAGADPQIVDDLPNEFGQGQKQFGDNHDTLTGSNATGMLNSADPLSTCMDWRCPGNAFCPEAETFEKKVMGGHSWPREANAGGGPGGGNLATQQTAACVGLQAGDACTVNLNKGPIESTCFADEATGELSCDVPVSPGWFFACSGAAVGASCNVDKGPQQFDGTCVSLEGVSSLACVPEDFDPSAAGAASGQDPANWIAAHTVPGCNPGIQLEQLGGGQGTLTVGGGGGYGGLYCFALTP